MYPVTGKPSRASGIEGSIACAHVIVPNRVSASCSPATVPEHRAAAADAAHLGVDHALHEGARDGRVDRIAPAPHDLEPDLGRNRLGADDDRHEKKSKAGDITPSSR